MGERIACKDVHKVIPVIKKHPLLRQALTLYVNNLVYSNYIPFVLPHPVKSRIVLLRMFVDLLIPPSSPRTAQISSLIPLSPSPLQNRPPPSTHIRQKAARSVVFPRP